MCQLQLLLGRAVLNHQQPGTEAPAKDVPAVADRALRKLHQPEVRIFEEDSLECSGPGKLFLDYREANSDRIAANNYMHPAGVRLPVRIAESPTTPSFPTIAAPVELPSSRK